MYLGRYETLQGFSLFYVSDNYLWVVYSMVTEVFEVI